jgi:hypothetical protein
MVRPQIGASPSGKAPDFDSGMRRFESSRPSQLAFVSERSELTNAAVPAKAGTHDQALRMCRGWQVF